MKKLANKKGRPTDSFKDSRVTARIEADVRQRLIDYCKKQGITEAKGVRLAVLKLLEEE